MSTQNQKKSKQQVKKELEKADGRFPVWEYPVAGSIIYYIVDKEGESFPLFWSLLAGMGYDRRGMTHIWRELDKDPDCVFAKPLVEEQEKKPYRTVATNWEGAKKLFKSLEPSNEAKSSGVAFVNRMYSMPWLYPDKERPEDTEGRSKKHHGPPFGYSKDKNAVKTGYLPGLSEKELTNSQPADIPPPPPVSNKPKDEPITQSRAPDTVVPPPPDPTLQQMIRDEVASQVGELKEKAPEEFPLDPEEAGMTNEVIRDQIGANISATAAISVNAAAKVIPYIKKKTRGKTNRVFGSVISSVWREAYEILGIQTNYPYLKRHDELVASGETDIILDEVQANGHLFKLDLIAKKLRGDAVRNAREETYKEGLKKVSGK